MWLLSSWTADDDVNTQAFVLAGPVFWQSTGGLARVTLSVVLFVYIPLTSIGLFGL